MPSPVQPTEAAPPFASSHDYYAFDLIKLGRFNMITNNTTDDSSCPDRDWYIKHGQQASLIDYYKFSPIFTIFNFLVHGLYLKAFYTQVKKENGYAYQIIVTINDIIVTITFGLYLISFQLLANPRFGGPLWYRTCYSCMWFSKIAGLSFVNLFYTMSLFLTICMSADRFYALWKPVSYKATNTKRTAIRATCCCFALSFLMTLMEFFAYTVQPTSERVGASVAYILVFTPSQLVIVWNTFRSIIQALCIPVLYICDIALLRFYRIRLVEGSRALNIPRNEKRAREVQEILSLLAICQCVWMTIYITSIAFGQLTRHLYPTFNSCMDLLYLPVQEMTLQILYTVNLFVVPTISTQFRKMIRQELPCFKRRVSVANIATSQARPNQQPLDRAAPRQVW